MLDQVDEGETYTEDEHLFHIDRGLTMVLLLCACPRRKLGEQRREQREPGQATAHQHR